jgi:hypothetical protein
MMAFTAANKQPPPIVSSRAFADIKRPRHRSVENTFNYPTLAEAYKISALDAWNRMPKRQPSARLAELVLEKARRAVA